MSWDKIFHAIDQSEDRAVALETALTKRPAVSPDSGGLGELDKCLFLESWLSQRGLGRLERFDAPDPRAKGGIRPNLVLTIPGTDGEGGGRLWIMSHLDVVPPGEVKLWTGDPWTVIRRDDGPLGSRLIGRGVEDNQQGLTASVIAALALADQNRRPRRTVKLLFAADEEQGSRYGIQWLLEQVPGLFRKEDLVLIPDGGDPRGETIEIAEKNLLWAQCVVRGKQAHGSRPDQGVNAHLAAADLALSLHHGLSEIFAGEDPLFDPPYSTIQPTKREANVPNINTIPGEDVFYMDMRILPRYSLQQVRAEIDRIKGAVERKHRVAVTITPLQSIESKPTPGDAPLVSLLAGAVKEVYGVEARPIGVGGGTVGAYLRNQDIHAAVWSRIEHTAHQPDEYVLIRNILGDAKVMALLMLAE